MMGRYVRDLMRREVISCTADTTVREAMDLLDEHRIKLLVVVDGPGYLAGVVSQTDLMRAWRKGGAYEEVMSQPVRSIMSAGVITCMSHISIERAAAMLTEHQIHHLVIVEEHNDGRVWPIGVVSTVDIVRSIGGVEQPRKLKVQENEVPSS
jgi:CBS-domain-containing membrane protein